MALQGLVSRYAHQRRSRAVVKTACYRVFMIAVSISVAWLVVGDVAAALSIGLATNVVKTITYYLYERLWDHITWGVPTSEAAETTEPPSASPESASIESASVASSTAD